jgi:hypothetical protein
MSGGTLLMSIGTESVSNSPSNDSFSHSSSRKKLKYSGVFTNSTKFSSPVASKSTHIHTSLSFNKNVILLNQQYPHFGCGLISSLLETAANDVPKACRLIKQIEEHSNNDNGENTSDGIYKSTTKRSTRDWDSVSPTVHSNFQDSHSEESPSNHSINDSFSNEQFKCSSTLCKPPSHESSPYSFHHASIGLCPLDKNNKETEEHCTSRNTSNSVYTVENEMHGQHSLKHCSYEANQQEQLSTSQNVNFLNFSNSSSHSSSSDSSPSSSTTCSNSKEQYLSEKTSRTNLRLLSSVVLSQYEKILSLQATNAQLNEEISSLKTSLKQSNEQVRQYKEANLALQYYLTSTNTMSPSGCDYFPSSYNNFDFRMNRGPDVF